MLRWVLGGLSSGLFLLGGVLLLRRRSALRLMCDQKKVLAQIELEGGFSFVSSEGLVVEYFLHGARTPTTWLIALPGAMTTGNLFAFLADWAREKCVGIIAPSLPGMGLSAFTLDRELWARAIEE